MNKIQPQPQSSIRVFGGLTLGEEGEGRVLVATTGRVKVNVDATNGPIEIGDLLVTSDREGFAMKSLPVDVGGVPIHRPETLIGKALEPLAKGYWCDSCFAEHAITNKLTGIVGTVLGRS